MISVGICIFGDVEVLDFAGPFEVFSLAEDVEKNKLFSCHMISESMGVVAARNGLMVLPSHSFRDCPELDVLIIPGGYGAETVQLNNQVLLSWIKERDPKLTILASVCTGAFILANTGLLSGCAITMHWMDIDALQKSHPELCVQKKVRYIDTGHYITSGGISAGIEMSLHIVDRLCGRDAAVLTAKRMEYSWEPDEPSSRAGS